MGQQKKNSLPLCFIAFKLLKENSKIIVEENEFALMQNHNKSMEKINKMLQHSSHVFSISSEVQLLVEDETENWHVQKYAYSKETGESIESGETTLPLRFYSFNLLKNMLMFQVCSC